MIWVVVSKQMQLEKIQESIATRMGFFSESCKNKNLQEKASDMIKF